MIGDNFRAASPEAANALAAAFNVDGIVTVHLMRDIREGVAEYMTVHRITSIDVAVGELLRMALGKA